MPAEGNSALPSRRHNTISHGFPDYLQGLNQYAKAQTGDATPKPKGYIDANPRPKGYSPALCHPRIGDRKVCEIGRGCAPLRVFLNHPDETDPKPAPVLKTPPAHPVTNGRDTNSCPMRVMETQIGFMLGGCIGEGVTTGINLSEPGDTPSDEPGAENGEPGTEHGQTGVIRDPSNGRIVTNQHSTDRWVKRQVAKERWYKLNE